MAIYHNRTKIFGRQVKDVSGKPLPGKQNSIVSKAAYRAGQKLRDERGDQTWDYSNRKHAVCYSEILAPDNAPEWLQGEKHGGQDSEGALTRERLWNTIERVEKRKDSQLAREFELALPREFSAQQNVELVRNWAKKEIVSQGFVVDFAIHDNDENNPHAHVLCTMRPVDPNAPEGFGKKPDMSGKFNGRGQVGVGAKADLADWRETWAEAQNTALDAAGFDERVDHRTLEAQGIDRDPGVHIGVAASAMERKGIATERGELSIWGKMDNMLRSAWRGIERDGEVPQTGTGNSWWERAQVAIKSATDHFTAVMADESSGGHRLASPWATVPDTSSSAWVDTINTQRGQQERAGPDPSDR